MARLIREIGDSAFGAGVEAEALDRFEGLNVVGECGVGVREKTRAERAATERMVLIVMAGLLVI